MRVHGLAARSRLSGTPVFRPRRFTLLAIFALVLGLGSRVVFAQGNIDPLNDGSHFAYGENVGWINFKPSFGPGVTVTDSAVTGFAWGENVGWINLSPATGGVVNDGAGNLSGFAYGENVGWVSFSCTNTGSCASVDYGVTIDQATGEFIGEAYGENIGWIVFDSTGAVDFGVTTSGIPTDVFPPTTSASFPGVEWNNTNVTVTLTATDDVDGSGIQEIHHRVDGDPEVVTPGATAVVSITADGIHTVHFFAVDNAGNPETEQAVTIKIDTTPPDITIASPTNGTNYFINQNVLAGYSASDSLSGVAVLTGTVLGGSAIATTPFGLHSFTVTATDVAGNTASTSFSYTVVFPGNIDPTNLGSHFAWGENVGWINFKPSHGPGVTVTNSAVIGFAWGENIGWIDLSPSEGGVFNDGAGNLSGFAYGENVGWISFSCENTSSCSTADYGVKVDPENGRFSGHAWGENIGWIRFLETGGPAAGVITSWRPTTASTTATRRVSVDSSGNEGTGPQGSASPTISANGRFVAFQSRHTNLAPGDSNAIWDVFVHDRDADVDGIFDEPGEIATAMVSVSSAGAQGNFESRVPSISADGRFVAFSSVATNLVTGDTNGQFDVFVHDRDADGDGVFDEPGGIATTRASVNGSGAQGNFGSDGPRISASGRFVCFRSDASNLVPGDINVSEDTFVHDRDSDADGIFDEPGGISTTRVSLPNLADQGTLGTQANSYSNCRGISADGRFVALLSGALNLVLGDTNGFQDLFVHDRATGATTRVSVPNQDDQGSLGAQANDHTFSGAMSADGSSVAFDSSASNLVVGDNNGSQDIFVYDLGTDITTRVSVDSDGNEGGSFSSFPSLSADGRFVAFESFATNLVLDDTNGTADIFVHDRQSGTTTRVSIPNSADQAVLGDEANGSSQSAAMSADGRSIAFSSFANNLVLDDTNSSTAEQDVFVHDRGN